MNYNNKKNLLVFILLNSACLSFGTDLIDIYKVSEKNDPTIAQAREVYKSVQEELPITRSQLLPQLNLSASRGISKIERIPRPQSFYYKMYDLRLDQVHSIYELANTRSATSIQNEIKKLRKQKEAIDKSIKDLENQLLGK